MPIENNLKLLRDTSWREQNPIFDVESDVVEWAKWQTEIWLKRWENGTQPSWLENRPRNNYVGLIGQKCFEIVLQQLDVPYVPNDATIDWRGKKDYDFKIPNVGTIEVKSVDSSTSHKRVLVKCAEWHNSDYVLAVKLNDETPSLLQFVGFATKEEVQKTFTYAEGCFPCFDAPCWWEFLEKLHPATEFFKWF
jgi:hypothetical protein